MKLIALALTVYLGSAAAHARHIDFVEHSMALPAVQALKQAFPICEKPSVKTKVVDGITNFTIEQPCKKSAETPAGTANDDVVITITGVSAPWGELGNIEVKVGSFCAGNCEI